jgi:hypothetical protein
VWGKTRPVIGANCGVWPSALDAVLFGEQDRAFTTRSAR